MTERTISSLFILLSISLSSLTASFMFLLDNHILERCGGDGVSKYKVTQSVLYDVQINFTLTNYYFPENYQFLVPRIDNRIPSSTLSKYCPPYQESIMLYNKVSSVDAFNTQFRDSYNNTYDQFNTTLNYGQKLTIDQHYQVRLNEIAFGSINEGDYRPYDPSSYIFDLYCNTFDPYHNITDPELIAVSNSIVNTDDPPAVKTQKIHLWVSNYLEYEVKGEQMGASWAYDNQRGDCSEFSSLMITLLRIQGIPARKVVGFMISLDPSYKPKKGNQWTLLWDNSEVVSPHKTLMVHAWVEYYIPCVGWIACDPTWEGEGDNYFNRMDFLRFTMCVGEIFYFPCIGGYSSSELTVPMFTPYYYSSSPFLYEITIRVIGTNYILPYESIIIISIIGIVVIVLISIKVIKKRRSVNVEETDKFIIIQ